MTQSAVISVRLVLDTDVLVAALRSRHGASWVWLDAVLGGQVTLLVSVPVILEYEAVLTRPAQLSESGFSADEVRTLIATLCRLGQPVPIWFSWRPAVRDPNDDMFVELAINGQADRLLSFNIKDYDGAARFGIRVLPPGPALAEWRASWPNPG